MDTYSELLAQIVCYAKAANPEEQGDYKKDGLLYCGICHTPKQTIVELFGNVALPCLCKCKQAEIDKAKADTESEAAKRYIARLRDNAFGDTGYNKCRFDTATSSPLIEIMKKYADSFNDRLKAGEGLVLRGGTGVGKSYAAACLVNALVDKKYRCKFTSFARLYGKTDWDNRQDEIDALCGIDLLVIDDYGAERDTETMTEFKWSVIESRVSMGLPMVVTTNMTDGEFQKKENEKLSSRLLKACLFYDVGGKDQRKTGYAEMSRTIKKELGMEETK